MKYALFNLCLCVIVSLIIAPFVIKWLRKLKFGQSILIYVEKHKSKSGTPTMGGIIFVLSAFVGFFAFYSKHNMLATISMLSFLFFGVVGFLDDYIKIKYKQNEGLKPYQKMLGQFGIATVLAIFVYKSELVGSVCNIPFSNATIDIGIWIIPMVIVVYLAIVNSVNLIDGLDGLCSSVSFIVIIVMCLLITIMSGAFDGVELLESQNLVIANMGVAGALLGFLMFNSYPARVFMGDTGSLALGGAIASLTIFSKNYFLIMIVGVMFVLTTLSVILQVTSYKLTGKRIFKMSPLHHHFEQTMSETKVVTLYVLVTIIVGLLTIGLYL